MVDGSRSLAPRCDLDAEAAVLSACLLDTDAALEALELLEPAHFYADANRRIFEAVGVLAGEGSKIDVVAVLALLRAQGRDQQIGGSPYLAQLAYATPAIAHMSDHARIVRGWARVRLAGEMFTVLATEAKTAPLEDIDGWLESCESRAYTATANRGDVAPVAGTYRELATEAFASVERAAREGRNTLGLNSGFRTIDQHLGGLCGGELIIIAGRPGSGKTAWCAQILENVAKDISDPAACLMFSQEMPRAGLMMRSLARAAGTTGRALRTGSVSDWGALTEAAVSLGALPIMIDDEPRLTPMRLRAKIRRHASTIRQQYGAARRIRVIGVDYIQLMSVDGARKNDTRANELGTISRELKLLAKEMDATVIALSQLRRPERGKTVPRPELSDLRDSGALEADADVVMAIHRADEYRKPGEAKDGLAEIGVLKGRSSGSGWHLLKFDGSSTSFHDLDGVESAEKAFGDFDRGYQ